VAFEEEGLIYPWTYSETTRCSSKTQGCSRGAPDPDISESGRGRTEGASTDPLPPIKSLCRHCRRDVVRLGLIVDIGDLNHEIPGEGVSGLQTGDAQVREVNSLSGLTQNLRVLPFWGGDKDRGRCRQLFAGLGYGPLFP